MDTQSLQVLCNVIILLGAVAGAITGILALLGKPLNLFKKHREKVELERRKEIVNDVVESVNNKIVPKLNEIRIQNEEQNKNIAKLTKATRNSIGAEIMAFYEAHKSTRRITESEKNVIEDLYKSYKAVKGNNYVDQIYDSMTCWTVVTEDGKVIDKVTWWKPPVNEEEE